MSTLKAQKLALDARVCEVIHATFPEFKCTITDIKFPKKDFVIKFYLFYLEQLYLSPAKAMIAPIESQLQGESLPELYQDTLQLSNLAITLRSLLTLLQTRDGTVFGLDDLVEPNSTRNTAYMFCLLNFYNFANGRLHDLSGKLEVISQRKAEMESLLEQREKLSRELNQRALSKVKRLDIAKEVKAKKGEMEDMKSESDSLQHLFEKKELELEEVKRHRSRVQSDVAEARATYQKMEAQVVQSPDVLKSNMRHLEDKLKDVKLQLEQKQLSNKEKKNTIKLFESVEKNVDVRMSILTDIVEEAKSSKDCEKKLEDLKSELKNALDETEASQAQLSGLKTEITRLSAMHTNLQLQREKNKSGMKETIRHLQEEEKTLEMKQNSEVEGTLQAIKKYQEEIDHLVNENDKRNKAYEKLYAELMRKEQLFIAQKLSEIDTFKSGLESED